MSQALAQVLGALSCVAAAATLASQGVISGSDALAVISAVTGYFIHASGTIVGSNAAPKMRRHHWRREEFLMAAVDDLNAAVAAFTAVVAQIVSDVTGSVSATDVEAAVAAINQGVAQLTAALPPTPAPAPAPAPTT